VLKGVRHLHVANGKKIATFDLSKDRPSDDELLGMLLGRSGKLRAPALRSGDMLVVGFNQDLLASTLL
jgi:arsenate reductase-like glutaredoxin family protein